MQKLKIKVENMQSPRGGEVANQFVIKTAQGEYFQSYKSIIAFVPNGEYNPEADGLHKSDFRTQLDANYWDYRQTTGKYRNLFLGEDKKETERKIKEGNYILTDLN